MGAINNSAGTLQVADAEAEAKDNFKYLQTLQASYEAFYKGSLKDIIAALPSILGSFHTMHGMARSPPPFHFLHPSS